MTEAARLVVELHHDLSQHMKIGSETANLDEWIGLRLRSAECTSCFLRYRSGRGSPFPSHATWCFNNCIIDGTANTHRAPISTGDVVKVNIGLRKLGWVSQAAWTYMFGEVGDEALRLRDCGREALRKGIQVLKPGAKLLDWATVVQEHVEKQCGFHPIAGLGGSGYGRRLHSDPWISNIVPSARYPWPDAHSRTRVSQTLAVTPIVAAGTRIAKEENKHWGLWTADGSLSVQYGACILITEDGPRDLTAGLSDVHDVIDR